MTLLLFFPQETRERPKLPRLKGLFKLHHGLFKLGQGLFSSVRAFGTVPPQALGGPLAHNQPSPGGCAY